MREDKKQIDSQDQFDKICNRYVPNVKNYILSDYTINADIRIYDFNTIDFDRCTFQKSVVITGFEKSNDVKIKNCLFEDNLVFDGTFGKPITLSQDCIFQKKVKFDGANFKNKVRIQDVKFEDNVTFENTKFNDLCDFWSTEFQKATIFYKTDFLKTVVFTRTKFYENILFTYSLINDVCIFQGTSFLKGLDLSLAIINGSLTLFGVDIKNFQSYVQKFSAEEYDQFIQEKGIIVAKNKRETFRIAFAAASMPLITPRIANLVDACKSSRL